jgi:DNA topoisomerase IA
MTESREYYRRRLPHFQPRHATFSVTSRLANSLPREVIVELMRARDQRLAGIKEKNETKRKLLEAISKITSRNGAKNATSII